METLHKAALEQVAHNQALSVRRAVARECNRYPGKHMRNSLVYITLLVIAAAGCGTDNNSASQDSPQQESRVVFRAEDGRELTTDDLGNATGTFEYEVVSANGIPSKANELHQRARQLGGAGEYQQAIELFTQLSRMSIWQNKRWQWLLISWIARSLSP